MPAAGPKVIFEMEKTIGVNTSNITYADTFTNQYAEAANKLEDTQITSAPVGSIG